MGTELLSVKVSNGPTWETDVWAGKAANLPVNPHVYSQMAGESARLVR